MMFGKLKTMKIKKLFLYLTLLLISCTDLFLPKGAKPPFTPFFFGNLQTIDNTIYEPKMNITLNSIPFLNGAIYNIQDGEVGKKKVLQFFIENVGNRDLELTEIKTLSGGNAIKITKFPTKVVFKPLEFDLLEITYEPVIYGSSLSSFGFITNTKEDNFTFTLTGVVQPPSVTPGTIDSISHTINADTTVTLSWTPATNASSYYVYKSDPPPSIGQALIGEVITTNYILTGIKGNTTQYYKIKAKSSEGLYGEITEAYEITIPPTFYPNATKPTNFQIAQLTNNGIPVQLTLIWDSSANASFYRIYRDIDSSIEETNANLFGVVLSNSLVYLIPNEDRGKTFFYKVVPFNTIESKGIESDIVSNSIPLSLKGYNNVTWKLPNGYDNVTYDNHVGYNNVSYQEFSGYENVTFEEFGGYSISYSENVITGSTRDCTGNEEYHMPIQWLCPTPSPPCPSEPNYTYTREDPFVFYGGIFTVDCWKDCYRRKTLTNVTTSCPADAPFETNRQDVLTWVTRGTIVSSDPNNFSTAPFRQDSRVEIWTPRSFSSYTENQYNIISSGVSFGLYRNLNGTKVWANKNESYLNISNYNLLSAKTLLTEPTIRNLSFTSKAFVNVGNQGYKSNTEFSVLKAQQTLDNIRNLIGSIRLIGVGNQGFKTPSEMNDLRIQVLLNNIYDLYDGEPVFE